MDAFEPLKRLANPDNLVDRITEAEKANLVQPTQIGNNLEEMAGNTGDLIVGNLISPAPEVEVMDVTSTDFTGSFMSGEGFTFDSEVYNVGGVNAGVLQFGLSQTNGKAYAGAGAVIIGEDGVNLKGDNTSTNRSAAINFVDSNNAVIGYMAEIYNTPTQKMILENTPITSTDSSNIILSSNVSGSGGSVASIYLDAYDSGAVKTASLRLDTTNGIVINENGEDVDTRIESDGNANAIFVDGGNNRVGILNGSPTVALDVTGSILASGDVTAATLNSKAIWRKAYKAADQSKTSDTALANDSDLIFNPITNGEKYAIRGRIFFDTAATPDFKYRLGGSATITPLRIFTKHVVPGTTTLVNAIENAFPTTTQAVVGAGTTGGYIEIDGEFVVTGTGTIALQWAQNTSNASATTVLSGSYMEILKVN